MIHSGDDGQRILQFDSCQLTFIRMANIRINRLRVGVRHIRPACIGKCQIVYLSEPEVFHLSPRDGHVIILTAVNLIVLIQMVYIGLHEVSVRVGLRYVNQIFSEESLPNFLTHGAPLRQRAPPLQIAILLAVEKLERFRGSVQIFVRSKFLTTRGTGSHLKAF